MPPNATSKRKIREKTEKEAFETKYRVVEKSKAKSQGAKPQDELSLEFRQACWWINLFYVTFLGFFAYLEPSMENVKRFFAFTILGALIYVRYVLLSD